jgi:hypothetical protein
MASLRGLRADASSRFRNPILIEPPRLDFDAIVALVRRRRIVTGRKVVASCDRVRSSASISRGAIAGSRA